MASEASSPTGASARSTPSERLVGWVLRKYDTKKSGSDWRLFAFKCTGSPGARKVSIEYSHGGLKADTFVGQFAVGDLLIDLDEESMALVLSGSPGVRLPETRPSARPPADGPPKLDLQWPKGGKATLLGQKAGVGAGDVGREHLVFLVQVCGPPLLGHLAFVHLRLPHLFFFSAAVASIHGRPPTAAASRRHSLVGRRSWVWGADGGGGE